LLFISVSKTPPEALGVKNIYERLVKELGDKNLEPIPSDSEGSLKEIPTVMCSEVGGHQLFNICVHKDSISLVLVLLNCIIRIHHTIAL